MQESDSLESIEKMVLILKILRDHDGARVTEIADQTQYSKSTVHRYLKSLKKHQLVVKEGDIYQVGLRFLDYGEYARTRRDIHDLARPLVDDLAEKTEERALFEVEENGRAVYIYRGIGERAVKTDSRIGTYRYMHTIAGGKAILANLSEQRREEILDRWGLPKTTEATITDRSELYEELKEIRNRGAAFNDEETIEGLRAVAVPVLDSNETVHGALTVSGPTHRIRGDLYREEIPNLLLGTANELKLNLEFR